jgi:hypothetical protein
MLVIVACNIIVDVSVVVVVISVGSDGVVVGNFVVCDVVWFIIDCYKR